MFYNPFVMDLDIDRQEINLITDACRYCSTTVSCDIDIFQSSLPDRSLSNQIKAHEAMLKETFDIQISYPTKASELLCKDCINRLNEASCFKKIVKDCEQLLLEQSQIMCRLQDPHADMLSPCESHTKLIKVDASPLVGMRVESCDEQLDNDGASDGTSLNAEKGSNDWTKIAERRGKGPLLRENSLKLISNSTLCVFQWNKSRCRCFCCQQPFSDVNLLREHMVTHNIQEINKKIIAQQNRLIKVEISLLICKLCNNEINNIKELRLHLETHGVKFASNEDLLVPFKIESDLKCQICKESFSVFRLLNIHMNKHFQNHVCHICGAVFSNLVFLNLHKSRSHTSFVCKSCNTTFQNRTEKKQHDRTEHGVKIVKKFRFPCPYCSERFLQENLRILHLVSKHGMEKPAHSCVVCLKEFITKSLRNNHMKNVHMKEKKFACDVCQVLFYTKSDVARHKITHTGEKKHSCSICNHCFGTKDSLRRHFKRTHGDLFKATC